MYHLSPSGGPVKSAVVCPLCRCAIQRTETDSAYGPGGTLQEGVAAHFRVVHPGHAVPQVVSPR